MGIIGATLRLLGADIRALDVAVVDGSGNQLTGFDASRPANATVANVVTSTTSATLFAANPARRRIVVHNESNNTLFVKFGATASPTSYTVLIPKQGLWEGPLNDYTGVVDAVLSGGTGTARVTEITT